MPQPRVLDLSEKPTEPSGVEQFFSNIQKSFINSADRKAVEPIWEEHLKNRQDKDNYLKTQIALEKANISPSKRLEAQNKLNEMQKIIIEQEKAFNSKVNKGVLTQEEKVRQKGNLITAGWPEEVADLYLDSKPGVQQILAREHKELAERGLRKPLVRVPEGVDQQSQSPNPVSSTDDSAISQEKPVFVNDPETPQSIKNSNKSKPVPENEWPELPKPEGRTNAEKVSWENNNEKENSKLLKETIGKKHLLKNKDNRINVMTKINDGKYLPDGFGRLILIDPNTGEVRPSAQLAKQINPQTSLYIKNLNQYLDGIKEQLGSVVTDFDVRTFKSQLPNLLTDEQGRRLILKQMKYTSDLESVYNNTLDEALKKYGKNASYIDISQVVEDKVREKESDLIGKIDNLVEASDYINMMAANPDQFRGKVVMQKPDGTFRAVPKEKVADLKSKNWRDF